MRKTRNHVGKNKIKYKIRGGAYCLILIGLHSPGLAWAEESKLNMQLMKKNVQKFLAPESSEDYRKVSLNELSKFDYQQNETQSLPVITGTNATGTNPVVVMDSAPFSMTGALPAKISIYDAVKIAVLRHPDIAQSISSLSSQNANIDVAKAGYYPQLTGGLGTGDMTSGEAGRQLLTLSATQMLYDFGKVKSGVNVEKARLQVAQANVLVSIDDISTQVATAIVNIRRYQEITRIAREQIKGISRIAEIANLRANAGISSQADPIQAQSYIESAQSNLIAQETQLSMYKQRLRTLVGRDISSSRLEIPDSMISASDLYSETQFNRIPNMMAAKAGVDVAKSQKEQTNLSRYPTLSVRGSLSQALNGVNPNNNKDNGFYDSIMLEATSNFYQGGAVASQTKAASFAEEAAKARVSSVYLDVLDQTRLAREQIENRQRQMQVLIAQQETTVRTKELYQEQYKLGTRTVVDLLNAEQQIHSANSQIESARYDIYDNLVQYISASGKARDVYQLNNLSIQGVEIQP